jgi:predicted transcriptional regulator
MSLNMHLLWARGPATGRTLHTWLAADNPLPYTTVMSACAKLIKRGLMTSRPATADEVPSLMGQPLIYAPTISEAYIIRSNAGRQERVLALSLVHDATPSHGDDDDIARLRERVARAERAAEAWEAEHHRARTRIAALERRAEEVERKFASAEWNVAALERQLHRPPRAARPSRPPRQVIIEYREPAGICRMCRAPAPPPHGLRTDELRVCAADECRKEASWRDNNAKQRRYNARRSAKATQ